MKMRPVKSSNIEAVGFEGAEMVVHFKNGTQYRYKGVAPEDYEHFVGSKSVGKHFHAHIRGKFEHEKVEDR